MDTPMTIGLDLTKNVFQVHGVDTEGAIVCRRQLRRSQMLAFFSRLEPSVWSVWRPSITVAFCFCSDIFERRPDEPASRATRQ